MRECRTHPPIRYGVPRPKRPERLVAAISKLGERGAVDVSGVLAALGGELVGDQTLAEAANYDARDPEYGDLKAKAIAIADHYCKSVWLAGDHAGRRPVKDRDEHLIARLAELFHDHSGWSKADNWDDDPEYGADYQTGLITFLVVVMVVNYPINGIHVDTLIEKVPPAYRVPRA